MALRPRLLAVRCCVLLTHSAPPAVVYPSGLAFYDGDRTDNLFFFEVRETRPGSIAEGVLMNPSFFTEWDLSVKGR